MVDRRRSTGLRHTADHAGRRRGVVDAIVVQQVRERVIGVGPNAEYRARRTTSRCGNGSAICARGPGRPLGRQPCADMTQVRDRRTRRVVPIACFGSRLTEAVLDHRFLALWREGSCDRGRARRTIRSRQRQGAGAHSWANGRCVDRRNGNRHRSDGRERRLPTQCHRSRSRMGVRVSARSSPTIRGAGAWAATVRWPNGRSPTTRPGRTTATSRRGR